jgi:hypothetical protein
MVLATGGSLVPAAPDKSHNFQGGASIYDGGVPLGLPHDLTIELDGDPGGVEIQLDEQGAHIEPRWDCSWGSIHMDEDFRTGWFV